MKRLFILIAVCMIGMVLPQGVFAAATVTVSGDVVTIKTNNAGDLATYLQNADDTKIAEISGATTIVFDGKFNGQDLEALNDAGCCTQSTVDMAKAEFENYNDMKFEKWANSVTTAITSQHVDPYASLPNNMFQNCSRLTDLTISSGKILQVSNNNNDIPPLENVTIGNKVTQIGNQWNNEGFANISTIKKVEFEDGGTVPLEFRANCFSGCTKLEEILIPARSTLIETMAFGNTGLIDVTFEATTEPAAPLVIKYQAFQNSKAIRNVYVNVDPKKKALVCEYDAFDFDVLDGQTNPENYEDMATLHFNEGDKEFYKGEWKEGLGFTQTELLAIRGENNQTITIQGLGIGVYYVDDNPKLVNNQNNPVTYSSYTYTQGYLQDKHPANGWQQFAKTGNEIPVLGDFLRSYSTATPYHMPTYGTSGKPIVKIYRIWDFKDGYHDGDDVLAENTSEDAKKEAFAREIVGHIPDHTGVIMLGITNDKVLYNFKKFEGTVTPFVFTDHGGDPVNDNLLVPSNDDTLPIGPTDKSGNEITHRNFGFKVYIKSGKKTGNFLRARPTTTIKPNHAYLKLKKDLFHWRNETGGTGDYNEEIYKEDANGASSGSKSMISFVYDFDEDEEFGGGIATVIRKAIEEADMEDGEFYTLQGVKVNKPTTKGVYIHNGKKVLVK